MLKSITPVVVVLGVVTASIVKSLAAPKTRLRSTTSEIAPPEMSMPLMVSSAGPVMARVVLKAPVDRKEERTIWPESPMSRILGVPVPVVPHRVIETTLLTVGVTVFWAVVGGTWTRQVGQVATAQDIVPSIWDSRTEPLEMGAAVGRV